MAHRRVVIKCIDCNYHASGVTDRAAMEALTDHRRWEQVIKEAHQ